MELPRHLAIIMDGNGRWAQSRRHHRVYGHVRGALVARQMIEECARRGLKNLTLFTFSTENWYRPSTEVHFLMTLLARRLKKETPTLIRNNIRFHCVGDISRLPRAVRERVAATIRETEKCTGMNLTFALSYGGRQEIAAAARDLAEQVAAGELNPADIDEALFAGTLESSFLPDPDLIIRTSGEYRLSNFFLWQAAYAEIFVCQQAWPDFSSQTLDEAFAAFWARERRFGRTSRQNQEQPVLGRR